MSIMVARVVLQFTNGAGRRNVLIRRLIPGHTHYTQRCCVRAVSSRQCLSRSSAWEKPSKSRYLNEFQHTKLQYNWCIQYLEQPPPPVCPVQVIHGAYRSMYADPDAELSDGVRQNTASRGPWMKLPRFIVLYRNPAVGNSGPSCAGTAVLMAQGQFMFAIAHFCLDFYCTMSNAFALKSRLSNSFSGYVPRLPERDNSQVQYTYDEQRRKALEEVDNASFSIFAIGIAETMIGLVYGDKGVKLKPHSELALKVSTQIGVFFGQLVFGWLADILGRKKMYGFELMIGEIPILPIRHLPTKLCLKSSLAYWLKHVQVKLVAVELSVLLQDISDSGQYPLSSVITSEFSPTKVRGRMMTAVFAMQGFGNFTAALVAFIVTQAYKNQINQDGKRQDSIDRCWRLLIGLGAIPGCIALYCRLTIPETPRFTMDVERNVEQAVQDVNDFLTTGEYRVDPDAVVRRGIAPQATWVDFKRHFGQWRNFKLIFGMAYSWFALDIPFYTLGLNTSSMLKPLGFISKACDDYTAKNAYTILRGVSQGNLILAVGGLIPGYWFTFLFIDSWGRKPIQIMGFIVLTVLFIVIGATWDILHKQINDYGGSVLIFLYCLANFFQNFGPNTTTFIVPGEAFPTRYRATAHGISAASGKGNAPAMTLTHSSNTSCLRFHSLL
ncbi:inorganic phosphate transporter [Rhizoctonia solani AG-1 IA]|uniref:Inorganic phosphate transporter n=1 Tax=Thanatephorus cucumeris (strain AG1-IA) TaxID=983506 RepID=L8WDN4_THACA|nr:inorganic phosphate transporter [Rhizoctonia solani AG-1 IA]